MQHKEPDAKLWQESHVSPRRNCDAAHSA